MHKAIDVFTDSHEIVSRSKARFGQKGYLKGVVVDLLYDHYLSVCWEQYSEISQSEFLNLFYAQATKIIGPYPENAKLVITRLVESQRLSKYYDFDGFIDALNRIDRRLTPRIKAKDSALKYLPIVEQRYFNLKSDFEEFFPELIEFFKSHELGCQKDNYLI